MRKIQRPGAPGVGHQWAYLPDVARTMVTLLERRDTLQPFARFHMAGHWDPDGTAMVEAIRRVARKHGADPKVVAFPWWLIGLASPFMPTLREMREMRYLWERPVRMSGARLQRRLGEEPRTPLDEAVEATLLGLDCLPANGPRAAVDMAPR